MILSCLSHDLHRKMSLNPTKIFVTFRRLIGNVMKEMRNLREQLVVIYVFKSFHDSTIFQPRKKFGSDALTELLKRRTRHGNYIEGYQREFFHIASLNLHDEERKPLIEVFRYTGCTN